MAKKNEDFVTHIASRNEDFPQWYTDVVVKTDMVDYSEVKGCMVIKPYGYAVWELIQSELDARFKETGHVNAYFPLFIPENLLKKEAEHVEGFAPEVAWVTHGGSEELAERLCVRPTSETIICSMYSKWIQSYRDLPVLINQWANVVRWGEEHASVSQDHRVPMAGRAYRSRKRGGGGGRDKAHAGGILRLYGERTCHTYYIWSQEREGKVCRRAGQPYTMEALMQDGKALQMGTSHNLGDHFAKAYDITYLSREGKLEYCHTTSWGTSTRMIGGVIMVHGDDRGLVLPPRVAPIQVVIIPIAAHKPGVLEKADELFRQLKEAGIRVKVDDSDQSAGWKFNQWEMKGVPVRLEIGPKDIENSQVVIVRRDDHEKSVLPMEGLTAAIKDTLNAVHKGLYERALAMRESKTVDAATFEQLKEGVKNGFVRAMWCQERECEEAIKEKTGATTRCMPFDQSAIGDVCVHCGKPAKALTYFAKAY